MTAEQTIPILKTLPECELKKLLSIVEGMVNKEKPKPMTEDELLDMKIRKELRKSLFPPKNKYEII